MTFSFISTRWSSLQSLLSFSSVVLLLDIKIICCWIFISFSRNKISLAQTFLSSSCSSDMVDSHLVTLPSPNSLYICWSPSSWYSFYSILCCFARFIKSFIRLTTFANASATFSVCFSFRMDSNLLIECNLVLKMCLVSPQAALSRVHI